MASRTFRCPPLWISALLLAAVWVLPVLFRASVNEDAFITFRVIDNFVHGYGLRWNVIERVQVYTHPLWMLINIPLYAMWGKAFYSSIAMGVLCSFFAGFVLLRLCPNVRVQFVLLAILVCSRSVIVYSTAGLENSLSHLLIACAAAVLLQKDRLRYPAFWLFLVFSGALLNRLDLLFLFAPMVFLSVLYGHIPFRPRQIAWGLAPLAAWFVFATVYYGSPLPNTYYAKLGGTLGSDYIGQGLTYLYTYMLYDWMDALLIMYVASAALLEIARLVMRRPANLTVAAIGGGILLHLAYIVYIGGDYMLGRFFTVDAFAAMACLVARLQKPLEEWVGGLWFVLFLAWFLLINLQDDPPFECWMDQFACPVATNNIFDVGRIEVDDLFDRNYRMHGSPRTGWGWKKTGQWLRSHPPRGPVLQNNIGQVGYYAGPATTFIDTLALTDMFLARSPAAHYVRAGHVLRALPKGYVKAFMGDYSAMDPKMAQMVQFAQNITRGPLFSRERLYNIYLLNTGWLDRELLVYYGKSANIAAQ